MKIICKYIYVLKLFCEYRHVRIQMAYNCTTNNCTEQYLVTGRNPISLLLAMHLGFNLYLLANKRITSSFEYISLSKVLLASYGK